MPYYNQYYDGYSRFNTEDLKWHHYLPNRDRIDLATRPINRDYTLTFGSGETKLSDEPVDTGYCDFKNRRCWVNCEAVQGTDKEQFLWTMYAAAHERAHARYTDEHDEEFLAKDKQGRVKKDRQGRKLYDRLLSTCWNLLEDERIERLIERDFRHLRKYMKSGAKQALKLVITPILGDSVAAVDPANALAWLLMRRLLRRARDRRWKTDHKKMLHPSLWEKFKKIDPIVQKAFRAKTSGPVIEYARQIIEILEIREFNKMMQAIAKILSKMCGKRQKGDKPLDGSKGNADKMSSLENPADELKDPRKGRGRSKEELEGKGSAGDPFHEEDDDELEGPNAGDSDPESCEDANALDDLDATGYTQYHGEKGDHGLAKYDEILSNVNSQVASMRHLFRISPVNPRSEFDRAGSRLDLRQARRNPAEPFLVQSEPKKPGRMGISVIVDESGSMSGEKEWQTKHTMMLFYESLRQQHDIRVLLTPTGYEVVTSKSGEFGRARIAGYGSHTGTTFYPVMRSEYRRLRRSKYTTKWLFLIADGGTGQADADMVEGLVASARVQNVHVLGIGVALSAGERESMMRMFGAKGCVFCKDSTVLTKTMGGILRTISRRHKGQQPSAMA